MQRGRAGLWLIYLVLSASACTSLCAAQVVLDGNLAAGGRHLQTIVGEKVADRVQDKWRSAGSALLTTVASVFTQANIELAKAAYEEVAGAWLAEHQPAAAAAAAAAAAPAQPVAQVVYLPSQDDGSGIKLHTNTPVEIRNPVTVDTPVRQDNVQIGGVSSWLGHRRLV